MGKVVDFESILKDSKKLKRSKLDYESLDHYRGLLEVQLGIMDMLFEETEELIRENNFYPEVFTLVEDSAEHFLTADLPEFFDGGEESLDLSYETVIGGVRYRTYAVASVYGDIVSIDSMFLMWDGTEWLVRSDDEWERGPGADFFGDPPEDII